MAIFPHITPRIQLQLLHHQHCQVSIVLSAPKTLEFQSSEISSTLYPKSESEASKFISFIHHTETQRPKTPEIVDLGKLLPQQETPVPKTKMKTINWNKIPSNKLMGKNNIWTLVANSHQNSPMAELDWTEMEGLFCQQATSQQNSPKMGARDTSSNSADTSNGSERKSRKENSEVGSTLRIVKEFFF